MIKSEALEQIKENIQKYLEVLNHFGYQFHGLREMHSQYNGTIYYFTYKNKNTKMMIEIGCGPLFDDELELFSVLVESEENGAFTLSNYFKQHEIYQEKDYFNLNIYSGNYNQQIKSFCRFVAGVFKNDLQEILLGKRWEPIYIHLLNGK